MKLPASWPVGTGDPRLPLTGRAAGWLRSPCSTIASRRPCRSCRPTGAPSGPSQHGTRRRSDGDVVEWWTAAPERIGLDGVPFLIHHAYAGAEWGAEALADRRHFRHPVGGPAVLLRLDIATPDPPALAARYGRELGIEFWAVADLAVCTVGRHTIRLVPRREMEVPAIVVLGAAVDAPRSATMLGLRFDVEPAEVTAVLAGG